MYFLFSNYFPVLSCHYLSSINNKQGKDILSLWIIYYYCIDFLSIKIKSIDSFKTKALNMASKLHLKNSFALNYDVFSIEFS